MSAFEYQRYLHPGERILWEGRPSTGLILRPMEVFLIPFSLLWGGFALFWNVSVWTMAADDLFFRLWGLPFLVAGFYITIGRFLVDGKLRSMMRYLITDQRILILRRNGASSKSLDIKRLPEIELEERNDGSGTIRFGSTSLFAANNFGIWSPALDPTPQFLRIDNVRSVYGMIVSQSR